MSTTQSTQCNFASLPYLGVGVGFRDEYRSDVFAHSPSIDFLEIIADHFFNPTPAKLNQLDLLQRNFTLIPHGLALSLGSADGLELNYLKHLSHIVKRLDPPWWSEHIAFTRAGNIDIGHLTPLPRSRESLDVLRENIKLAKEHIHQPLILENITQTIDFPGQEYDEAGFLGNVVEENDCGLLLDVTNLYINSINYRFDPLKVLWQLPKERIVQLHFVGGHWEDGVLIDSHSTATPREIWSLFEEVVKYTAIKGAILERDENLPPIASIVEELKMARSILTQVRTTCPA